MKRGFFLTFEGPEGSGKSTQARRLADALSDRMTVVLTHEPGGTPLADKIRALLLDPRHTMDARTELLLYAASRAEHISAVIEPALAAGTLVVCDRFSDSTRAYQGHGRGLDRALLSRVERIATGGLIPDLTLLLDMDPAEGLARRLGAAAGKGDRIESEHLDFHHRVRQGYLALARANPDRIVRIDARGAESDVAARVAAAVTRFLRKRRPGR